MLRVADVGVDDSFKRQLVSSLEFYTEVLCLDGELAAHGVLDVEHGWVEVVDGEGLHGVFETEEEVGETGRVIKSRG